jgi:hypothetical protein
MSEAQRRANDARWRDHNRSFGGACLDVAIMVVLLADMWLQRRAKR